MQSAPKVICLGEALLDRLGPLGVDPIAESVHQCIDKYGGAPANVACALARLGTPVAFVGRLGSDATADSFFNLFAERTVDVTGLQRDSFLPTRIVLVRRSLDGDRVFCGFSGDQGHGFSDQALSCSELQSSWPTLAANAMWLYVGTIPLASPLSSESLLWAIKKSLQAGIRIALDVNWRSAFWYSNCEPTAGPDDLALCAMQPLLASASLLKLAKEEADLLFGTTDPCSISASLPQGPDVVVTDGSHPVKWYSFGSSGVIDVSVPSQVVDTTGAGDAFSAGLLHQLVQMDPELVSFEQMLRFAAACGALVCTGTGAIEPQPSTSEILTFLGN